VKESYMAEEATDDTWDFFEGFLETQIFNVYCDRKLKDIDNFQEKKRLTAEEAWQEHKAEQSKTPSGGAAAATALPEDGKASPAPTDPPRPTDSPPSFSWQVSGAGSPTPSDDANGSNQTVVMRATPKDVPTMLKKAQPTVPSPNSGSPSGSPVVTKLDPRSPRNVAAASRKSAPSPHTRRKSDTNATLPSFSKLSKSLQLKPDGTYEVVRPEHKPPGIVITTSEDASDKKQAK